MRFGLISLDLVLVPGRSLQLSVQNKKAAGLPRRPGGPCVALALRRGHRGPSGSTVLGRHGRTDEGRRPRGRDGRARVDMGDTHARSPGRCIGLECIRAGRHIVLRLHWVVLPMDRALLSASIWDHAAARLVNRFSDLRLCLDRPAHVESEAIFASTACTLGGPARMLPVASQEDPSPSQSLTIPPASRTMTAPAATSHGPSRSSK